MNHLFKFDKPIALTLDEWDEWDAKTKKKYPIKWFFLETIPGFINKHIIWKYDHIIFQKLYWGFIYRFVPKHQYHIIRPSTLEPGYHNEYDLILHSSFHILVEFMEFEQEHGCINWQATKEHSEFWDEANRLIYWWKHIRTVRSDWMDRDYPFPDGPKGSDNVWVLRDKYQDTIEYKNWSKIADIQRKMEEQFEKDDENYLIRLMKIRMFLWN